jgi:hypothetical protein
MPSSPSAYTGSGIPRSDTATTRATAATRCVRRHLWEGNSDGPSLTIATTPNESAQGSAFCLPLASCPDGRDGAALRDEPAVDVD